MKKWTCRKVRLNVGGYEYGRWGKYYGHGEPLFKIENPSDVGERDEVWMIRGADRKQAILNFCDLSGMTLIPLMRGVPAPVPEDFYGFKR